MCVTYTERNKQHFIKMYTFQAFRPYFDAMARVGYFKVVLKPETKRQKKIHDFYRAFMWIAVLTYNVQHIVQAIKASSIRSFYE